MLSHVSFKIQLPRRERNRAPQLVATKDVDKWEPINKCYLYFTVGEGQPLSFLLFLFFLRAE